jgi:hypothetical protein
MDSVTEALHHDLSQTLEKIRSFTGTAGKAVSLLLQAYDVHNLKAILRGLSRNVPVDEILPTLLPIGELKSAFLMELVNARDARVAIDLLASLMIPYARPLVHLRSQKPGAPEFEMELALDRWYIAESRVDQDENCQKQETFFLTLISKRYNQYPHGAAFCSRTAEHVLHDEPRAVVKLIACSSALEKCRFFTRAGCPQDLVPAAVALLEGTPYAAPCGRD